MYNSSEHYKAVKDLMGGTPDVVLLWLLRLWKVSLVIFSSEHLRGYRIKGTHNIKEYSYQYCDAFKIIVTETSLLIKLGIWKDGSGMYDGRKSREASSNKGTDP